MNGLAESETQKLKLKIKRWEKEFEATHGRKPDKSDIKLADDCLKSDYKRYWKCIDNSNANRNASTNANTKANIGCKTEANNRRGNRKSDATFGAKLGPLKTISEKLMARYLNDDNNPELTSFSLKRKSKPRDLNATIAKENVDICDIDSKIVFIRAQSIDESALKAINCDHNVDHTSNCDQNSMTSEFLATIAPFCESLSKCVDLPNDDSTAAMFCDLTANHDLHSEKSQLSEENKNNKRKSDVYSFEDDLCWPPKKKVAINVDQDIGNDECDANESNEDSNEHNLFSSTKKTNKFFKSKDRKVKILNIKNEAFKKDLTAHSLNYELKRNGESVQNSKDKTKQILDIETEVTNDVKSKSIKTKSKISTNKDTPKSKTKLKQTNYKRLNMKKKVFASRGYKKFNVRKWKRAKWKANKAK